MYEGVATVYLHVRRRLKLDDKCDEGTDAAVDTLEGCRVSLSVRERELSVQSAALGREALSCRDRGDLHSSRSKVQVCFCLYLPHPHHKNN